MARGEREENGARWKRRVNYGARRIVEIVISPFKRRFGSAVQPVSTENIAVEMGHKVMIHNRMLAVAGRAIANA